MANARLPWIRIGGYAFVALAVLKSITLAIGLEQSKLSGPLIGLEIGTVVVAAIVAYGILGRGDARWLIVGLAVYAFNIAAWTAVDSRTLINGFFLKVGVLAAGGYALWQWLGLRQNTSHLHAAGFSESETNSLLRLQPMRELHEASSE